MIEREAFGVLRPRELREGLFLELGDVVLLRPLAPLRERLGHREDGDVLLLVGDLLRGHLLGGLGAADEEDGRRSAGDEDADDDGRDAEAPLLEVAVVTAAARVARDAGARGERVVVRRPLGRVPHGNDRRGHGGGGAMRAARLGNVGVRRLVHGSHRGCGREGGRDDSAKTVEKTPSRAFPFSGHADLLELARSCWSSLDERLAAPCRPRGSALSSGSLARS